MRDDDAYEHVLPGLLDRLTGPPRVPEDVAGAGEMTLETLRKCVLRDLAWLFNTTNLNSVDDLGDDPEVASSVVNYGVSGLVGKRLSDLSRHDLERAIHDVLQRFEPRLSAVTVRTSPNERRDPNRLAFEIEAELWWQPAPSRIFLRTEFDLESGGARVVDEYGHEVR